MLVTKFNQHVALADFKAALGKAEFLAFDEEMTGVDCADMPRVFGDTPEAIYESRKKASEMFNAFQFGVALFIPSEEPGRSYDVMPYNFFLLNAEGDVRLDLKTIPFHNTHKMDFQRWLAVGMRYCTAAEEAELKARSDRGPILTSGADKVMFDGICQEVSTWYTRPAATPTDEENAAGNEDEEEQKSPKAVADEGLSLSKPCGYLVAKALKWHFDRQTEMHLTMRYDGTPYFGENMLFTFAKVDSETAAVTCQRAAADREKKIETLLGFREFWKAILGSKKPVVGHNCYQDILFMIHMHEHKLPENYDEFKAISTTAFPTIYDTKTLASQIIGADAFTTTYLGGVYAEVRKRFGCSTAEQLSTVFRLPPGFYDYDEAALAGSTKAHEAGYDAYMTGVCFHFLRQLVGEDLIKYKNIVSVFGSVYFCCLSEKKDTLIVPSTFIIKSSLPCHIEQVEAILFTSQKRENVTVDGKVDWRRLEYKANTLVTNEEGMVTSICVAFKTDETVESVTEKIKAAAAAEGVANICVDLIPHLTVHSLA